MISTGGDVICIWDVSGHTLMLASAVKVAHDWKVKPKSENGRPIEFVDTLEIPVSANGNEPLTREFGASACMARFVSFCL